jgi:hypothetical protein
MRREEELPGYLGPHPRPISSSCCRCSANGCRPQPNNARICSAVTGSPGARPSIPSKPEPIHVPGVSPRLP